MAHNVTISWKTLLLSRDSSAIPTRADTLSPVRALATTPFLTQKDSNHPLAAWNRGSRCCAPNFLDAAWRIGPVIIQWLTTKCLMISRTSSSNPGVFTSPASCVRDLSPGFQDPFWAICKEPQRCEVPALGRAKGLVPRISECKPDESYRHVNPVWFCPSPTMVISRHWWEWF